MATITAIEKYKFRDEMPKECREWKELIEKYNIPISDLYADFDKKHPKILSYDGFYKSITKCAFTYKNYTLAKPLFHELKKKLTAIN